MRDDRERLERHPTKKEDYFFLLSKTKAGINGRKIKI